MELAEFLAKEIQSHTPEFSPARRGLEGWAREFDRMLRLDRADPEEVRTVIRLAHRGRETFWRSVLLSARKVRKHFVRLKVQFRNTPVPAEFDPSGEVPF